MSVKKTIKSKLINSLKNIIDIFLNKLNLKLSFIYSFVDLTTKAVGASATAEVFTYYYQYRDIFVEDITLNKFMDFYFQHWKKSSSQRSQDIFFDV